MGEKSHQRCVNPKCGSSDGFSFNSETGIFYCFVCQCKPSTLGGFCFDGKTIEKFSNKQEREEGIALEPYVKDNYRGIRKSILDQFGVYFTKHEGKETVHFHYPNGTIKHRQLPKYITTSGTLDSFYGQDDYNGGKFITITEGEEDRLSAIQMLGDYPVVSAPNATPSKNFWINARQYLKNFEKIVLSVDNDEPGDAFVDRMYKSFPGKVYRVNHGKYKDANDFLQDNAAQEYKQAWYNAQKVKPDGLNNTSEDFLKVYDETPNYEFFKTNIKELDEKMLGIHKGAVTLVLAPTGIGKTEFFRYIMYQCYKDSDYSFAFCHGEETELRSLLGLASYELQDNVTRKDLVEQKGRDKDVRRVLEDFGRSERLFQFKINLDAGVDDIIDDIRFMSVMGVDYFFIEPIQDFISGDTSTKENLLTDLINKMKRMAPELNVGIVLIAHANEDGDAKYCKSITQSAAYEIVLHRERDASDAEEANTTYVAVGRKNRTGGGSGPAGSLNFDFDSYTLTPNEGPKEPATPVMDRGKKMKDQPVVNRKKTDDDLDDDIPF